MTIGTRPFAAFSLKEPDRRKFGALVFRGGMVWRSGHREFGGLSALDVHQGRFTAFADTGVVVTGLVRHDASGRPVAVDDASIERFAGPDGRPYRDKQHNDAEGLARIGADLYVSLEQDTRIMRYRFRGASLSPATLVRGLDGFSPRRGLESLTAVRVEGVRMLLAVSEKVRDDRVAALLLDPADGAVRTLAIASDGVWAPTGATTLPDGDVVLLERRFTVRGPHMRLRRVAAGDLVPGALVPARELMRAGPGHMLDNMEAVAAFAGPGGELRLALLSDDNMFPFQRTLYLEFAFADAMAPYVEGASRE